ncbi:MAG: SDR family oxidoreductase [Hyphomicrobiales bacterium]|nr:SDR family oxidoreductase [Hyphomicrobiales bacterium]
MPDYGLAGYRAVIGGGSSGIGLAIAKALAAEGCNLHLLGRDASRLSSAREEIVSAHRTEVQTHAIDFADTSALTALIEGFSDVDILINNGAAAPAGSIESLDDATWRKAWDSKVFAYIATTRAMLRKMYARNSGVIVNIIGGGILNKYDYVCGTSGNAALIAFTNAVGSRSTDHGVRVVGINPTSTRTDTFVTLARARARSRLGDENRMDELFHNLPFGRVCEPEEVADMVVFAASPLASYLSGTCINLDGGVAHR